MPQISANGRYVAFRSFASHLVSDDTNHARDVFVRDRRAGRTELVSVGPAGQANRASRELAISGDGRYVAFQSFATNLARLDTDRRSGVFVRDRKAGVTKLVSVGVGGQPADNESLEPAVSGDGRHIGFVSVASNLIVNDTNGSQDIFVRDKFGDVRSTPSEGADDALGIADAASQR